MISLSSAKRSFTLLGVAMVVASLCLTSPATARPVGTAARHQQGAVKPRVKVAGKSLRTVRRVRVRKPTRKVAPNLKFVFTGGPGVGKTTLINALEKTGYLSVPEAARHIIAKEQKKADRMAAGKLKGAKPAVLPWTDLVGFQHRVIRQQTLWETKAAGKASAQRKKGSYKGTLLDRSFVDPVAYMVEAGMTPKSHPKLFSKVFGKIKKAGYRKVFVLDQLKNYANDAQRKEDRQQADKLHNRLLKVYQSMGKQYGFEVVKVPAVGVAERVKFVEKEMKR